MCYDPIVVHLNLLVMFLNSWSEESRRVKGKVVNRAWTGYPTEILDQLKCDGSILVNGDLITFTDEGAKRAERIKRLHC